MRRFMSFVTLVLLPGIVMLARVDSACSRAMGSRHEDHENPPGQPISLNCTSLSNWQCVETRTGLWLCRANNICVVKVDLNSSSFRPKVVIAPNGSTSWLSNMASGAGAYAAINGDYFSGCPDTVL